MTRCHFYIINILFCISLQAQDSLDIFLNQESLNKLNHGCILVRLESRDKKIQFLKNDENAKDCNEKCKKRIEHQIDEIISQRDQFNLQFIQSFKLHFTFCPVYFYYDKDHKALLNDHFKGHYYLNDSLQTIEINTIKPDSLLILKKDLTPTSGNEGWLFQTSDGATLDNGFPFITVNNAKSLFNRFISTDHLILNCNYMVSKLNDELYKIRNKK